MKARWLGSGVVIGLALALTLGFAYRGTASVTSGFSAADPDLRQAMEAMHDSPAMEAMHEQMPERLRQQCDELHDQMISSGFGMMGSGSGPGGMMGSGSAGMMGTGSEGMMGN